MRCLLSCLLLTALIPAAALAAEGPGTPAPGQPVFKASQGTRTLPPLVQKAQDREKLAVRQRQAKGVSLTAVRAGSAASVAEAPREAEASTPLD